MLMACCDLSMSRLDGLGCELKNMWDLSLAEVSMPAVIWLWFIWCCIELSTLSSMKTG